MVPRRLRSLLALQALVGGLALGGCAGEAPPPNRPPNLLLISVDTLRPDRLASYGHARDTSPAIGRLAAEGVLWENAYAPAPATVASHASLFTARQPHEHRTLNFGTPLPPAERTLAEILREAGYRTFAVTTSVRFHAGAGFGQGFERYEMLHELPKNARSAAATDRVLERVAEEDARPFFGFVHYFGPHAPYAPPEPWRSRWHEGAPVELPGGAETFVFTHRAPGSAVSAEALAYLEALYDAEISYLDRDLARLLDGLDGLGVAGHTLVVLVSDHGEEFKEHGGLSHARTLYEESLRVPLLMRLPGRLEAGRRVARPAQLVDVVPTALALLDVPVPEGLAGRALLSDSEGDGLDLVLGQRGTRQWSVSASLPEGRFKAVFAEGRAPELYRLDDDPGETRDLHADPRADVGAEAVLGRLVAADPRPPLAGVARLPDAEVPPEVIRQLAEIGYIDEVEASHPPVGRGPHPDPQPDPEEPHE